LFEFRFWFSTTALVGIIFIGLEYLFSTNSKLAAKGRTVGILEMNEGDEELFKKCHPATIFLLKQIQRNVSVIVYQELISLFLTELKRTDEIV